MGNPTRGHRPLDPLSGLQGLAALAGDCKGAAPLCRAALQTVNLSDQRHGLQGLALGQDLADDGGAPITDAPEVPEAGFGPIVRNGS